MTAEGSHEGGAVWPWVLVGSRLLAELASRQVVEVAVVAAVGAITTPEAEMAETAMVVATVVMAMVVRSANNNT